MTTKRRYNRKLLPSKNIVLATVIIIVLIAAAIAFYLYFEREKPTVTIAGEVDRVGLKKEYTLLVADQKSGLSHVKIKVRQKDQEKVIEEKDFERLKSLPPKGTEKWESTIVLDTEQLGLKDGPAELIIDASDFSLWNFFRGNLTRKVYPITVDTKPPKVSRIDSSRYIQPGGTGIVIYSVEGDASSHGVMLNGYNHPGSPLPGKEGQYVALIGLPYDAEKIQDLQVEARDRAGNLGRARFGLILKKTGEKHDRINITDSFLDWKIPEFSSYLKEVSGDKIEKFLYINETIRKKNNEKIMELCADSSDERHWEGRFLRMPGQRMSKYADRRTYFYEGKEIDQQVHLGIDLASHSNADVEAANHGLVKFADNLGIYGKTIIIDHGLGLFSLYAHLGNMDVNPGDPVEKGEKIATTDTTGMAGGDHLHFSMLVNGVFVDPVEWWDRHWIENSILTYLP
ncbi:MAG: M23 family metallopeptidase [Desulfurivibrionaceae bacterium]